MSDNYLEFYDKRRHETYTHEIHSNMESHSFYDKLRQFIEQYSLSDKKCLEIGSGRGIFQDMVKDYTGTDIAQSVERYYHKPYKVATKGRYPFENETFDAIWTITVFEHIPELQKALLEIKRLLRTKGFVYFAPAWQCRSWTSKGYPVRPYSNFDWKDKLIKSSIPIRNSVLWRSFFIFPKRLYRHLFFLLGRRYSEILYKKINPNYEHYWMSDSDACNSIDPHDAILWFESNGFSCLSHPLHLKAFFIRTGGIVFQKI
jgi:SAM-dependent methyltransferase